MVGDRGGGRRTGTQRGHSRAERRGSWSAMARCVCRHCLATKRGDPGHDVRVPSHLVRLADQVENSFCTWWAPDCNNFLESKEKVDPTGEVLAHGLEVSRVPVGVADHQGAEEDSRQGQGRGRQRHRKHYLQDVFRGAQGWAKIRDRKSKEFAHVGPARCMQAGRGGGCVQGDLFLCRYEGGSGNKHTTVLTNSQALRDALASRRCKGGKTCDRTGVAHETWTPTVVTGEILNFRTEADAEGLCEAVAKAIVEEYAETITSGYTWGFTKVFSGASVPLTREAELFGQGVVRQGLRWPYLLLMIGRPVAFGLCVESFTADRVWCKWR